MAAEAPPSDNLFIGDLPAVFTEDQVKAVFSAYGTVIQAKILPGQGKNAALVRFASQAEATWIKDNLNGNIAQGLSGPISVKYANPPGSGKGKGKDGGKGDNRWSPYGGGKGDGKAALGWGGDGWGGGWSPKGGKGKGGKGGIKGLKQNLLTMGMIPGGKSDNDTHQAVFVGGLPNDTTTEDLYEIFTPFGAVASRGCRAMTDEWGSCKGFGFVNYIDMNVAQTAIMTLNGATMPDGTALKVSIKTASTGKGEGKGM